MAFKIYTKTGDKGKTSLWGGARVPKNHIRIESYGTIDELNSYLGVVCDQIENSKLRKQLLTVQHRLFSIGSILATDPSKEMPTPDIKTSDVETLETWIDDLEKDLPPLKNFILPGGHTAASFAHVARCVCRRAERLVVALNEENTVHELVLSYLNRLSDYLFVLARTIAHLAKAKEVIWVGREHI